MTELEIAGYLDRGLSPVERERVENHLVECAGCRENLVEAQKLMHTVQRRPRLIAGGALVAAAAAAFFMIRPPLPSEDAAPLRSSVSAESPRLIAHGPKGSVRSRPIRFVWASSSGAASYRLTLSHAGGATLWSMSTTDTSLLLPDSVTVQNAEKYVWVVDAVLDDGSTLSTGLREFVPAL